MTFGENLRAKRKAAGLTQEALAKEAGIKATHMTKLESDQADPKLSTVYKLMKALKCSADDLMLDTTQYDDQVVSNLGLSQIMQEVLKLDDRDRIPMLMVMEKYCLAAGIEGTLIGNKRVSFEDYM